MKRRSVLAVSTVAISTSLVGCLGGGIGANPDEQNPSGEVNDTTDQGPSGESDTKTHSERDTPTDCEDTIKFEYACPEEVERKYISYEYLRIRNTGERTVDVTGFTVDYGNGNEYTIPELELEDGDTLEIKSQTGENTRLEMAPPVYIHYAGFGDSNQTSVMDGSGVVKLRNRKGDVIDELSYDNTDDASCLR